MSDCTEFDDAPAATAPSIAVKKPVKSKWEAVKLAQGNSDVEYDGDSVLDPREVEQGWEIKADLGNVFFWVGCWFWRNTSKRRWSGSIQQSGAFVVIDNAHDIYLFYLVTKQTAESPNQV
ncbi:hypothetical protein DFH29DRAFT_1073448 [Suillus ampliporus]|nr:hypothetical protein DFH29DRAFT_1073448 [Suillus ampliporus]